MTLACVSSCKTFLCGFVFVENTARYARWGCDVARAVGRGMSCPLLPAWQSTDYRLFIFTRVKTIGAGCILGEKFF